MGLSPGHFIPDLKIDLTAIDTAQYSNMYTLWEEVPVFPSTKLLIVKDVNKDGRKELYGAYLNEKYSYNPSYVIYELNKNGTCDSIYKYPQEHGLTRAVGSLENNGQDVAINSWHNNDIYWYLQVFRKDSVSGYPTQPDIIYDPSINLGQPVDVNFYDLDKDGYPEMIYYLDGEGDSIRLSNSFQIDKYNKLNKKFEQAYQIQPPYYSSGFAFGDFDHDGKENFEAGNISGKILVYECNGMNDYSGKIIDSLPFYNAFLQTYTKDMDNNGKPELWVGATTINGIENVELFLYEAYGDNDYMKVYSIEILGASNFFAFNLFTADLDNDKEDEVLLCIDQQVLVFKYIKDSYKLYYIKFNDDNGVFDSVIAEDIDGDNYPEILVSMDKFDENGKYSILTHIYKKTSTMGVGDTPKQSIDGYEMSEAYPNPFNPSTALNYYIPKESRTTIKIYDILGKEIKTLINDNLAKGRYKVSWNGTDDEGKEVASGIYFINMDSENFKKGIKIVHMK